MLGSKQGLGLLVVLILALDVTAIAQPTYSIDYQGPTKGIPDFTGIPITEGDLLGWGIFAPPAVPTITITGGFGPPGLSLPLHPGAVGLPAGMPGFVEVDAVSYGLEPPLTMTDNNAGWRFSGAIAHDAMARVAAAHPNPDLVILFGGHLGPRHRPRRPASGDPSAATGCRSPAPAHG